jgi:hypothetical protein
MSGGQPDMINVSRVFCAVALVLWSWSAVAQDGKVLKLVDPDGMSSVILWRGAGGLEEGEKLIAAGVNKTSPETVAPLIACIVPPGSRVFYVRMNRKGAEVCVIDGSDADCYGTVRFSHLQG